MIGLLTITVLRILVMAVCRAIMLLVISTMLDLPHTKDDTLLTMVAEVVEAHLASAGVSMLYRRFHHRRRSMPNSTLSMTTPAKGVLHVVSGATLKRNALTEQSNRPSGRARGRAGGRAVEPHSQEAEAEALG